jgi:hypothetical protein
MESIKVVVAAVVLHSKTMSKGGCMRNVVTLSDIPEETHKWLKQEAIRLTEKTGQKTHIYQVVLKAVDEYKTKVDAETSAPVTS